MWFVHMIPHMLKMCIVYVMHSMVNSMYSIDRNSLASRQFIHLDFKRLSQILFGDYKK